MSQRIQNGCYCYHSRPSRVHFPELERKQIELRARLRVLLCPKLVGWLISSTLICMVLGKRLPQHVSLRRPKILELALSPTNPSSDIYSFSNPLTCLDSVVFKKLASCSFVSGFSILEFNITPDNSSSAWDLFPYSPNRLISFLPFHSQSMRCPNPHTSKRSSPHSNYRPTSRVATSSKRTVTVSKSPIPSSPRAKTLQTRLLSSHTRNKMGGPPTQEQHLPRYSTFSLQADHRAPSTETKVAQYTLYTKDADDTSSSTLTILKIWGVKLG